MDYWKTLVNTYHYYYNLKNLINIYYNIINLSHCRYNTYIVIIRDIIYNFNRDCFIETTLFLYHLVIYSLNNYINTLLFYIL